MELLLDMSGQMQAIEEFVARHSNPTLTRNQSPIRERSHDHAQLDGTATTSSARVPTGCMESSGTIAPRVADEHVLEMAHAYSLHVANRVSLHHDRFYQ